MTPDATLEHIAARLRKAYAGESIQPIRDLIGAQNVTAAYEIQRLNSADRIASGRKQIGRKIGLTSVVVQRQLGVDQPDFGVLFDDMLVPQDGLVEKGKLIQPRIEGELAICFSQDVTSVPASAAELASMIEWVAPSLEIVDSRIQDWKIGIVDTVADNASSALFVLGDARLKPSEVDFVGCQMTLSASGEIVSQGTGAACLGNPLNAADWLVRKMIELGEPLRAGEIVLTGALGPMVSVKPATRYELNIEGVGSCAVSFE